MRDENAASRNAYAMSSARRRLLLLWRRYTCCAKGFTPRRLHEVAADAGTERNDLRLRKHILGHGRYDDASRASPRPPHYCRH